MEPSSHRVALVYQARTPTPQSREYQRDIREGDKWGKKAAAAFKDLLKEVQSLAEKAKAEFPGRGKTDLSRRGRSMMKALKLNNPTKRYLDMYFPGKSAEVEGWRGRVLYVIRDAYFKPKYKLKDAIEAVHKLAVQAWRVNAMEEAQAPLKAALPEVMLSFLPKNIVVDVDSKGQITRVTDRFENEFDTLELKIKRQHTLIQQYNKIAKKVKKDLRASDEITALAALVTSIIMETGIRPGHEGNKVVKVVDGQDVEIETFGAVTLGPQHVRFVTNFAELEFLGKKGSVNTARLSNAEVIKILANYVAEATKGKSKYVFVTAAGQRFTYEDLQRYFKDTVFKNLNITDFRKLKATEAVLSHLHQDQEALYERIRQYADLATDKLAERVAEEVAATINTAYEQAMGALSHQDVGTTIGAYINPQVVLGFLSRGHVAQDLKAAVMEGKHTLAFDPQAFIDKAIQVKMQVASIRTAGLTLQSLLDKIEEALDV